MSEVAHDVSGLRVRYLRVVPLEAVGGGAMRVCVYGIPPGGVHGKRICRSLEPAGEDDELPPAVYTLRTAEGVNAKYQPLNHRDYGWSKWCSDKVEISNVRLKRKQDAKEQAQGVGWE